MTYDILIVEDNLADKDLAVREITRHIPDARCTHAYDGEGFSLHLQRGQFHAVITDYSLRWGTGLDVLRAVKGRYPDKPVIMFTGTGNEELAVEAMKLGLDDYVTKRHGHYQRLAIALQLALKGAETRRQLQTTEAELRRTIDRLEHATRDLAERNAQLEEFMTTVTGRELRMAELVRENERLQAEVQDLKRRLHLP